MKKRIYKAYAFVIVLTLLIIPVQAGNNKHFNNTAFNENGFPQDSVTRLTKEVRHELLLLPYYGVFDWLAFEVNRNGEVTLHGEVTRPTLKSDAENVVEDIEGVTNVNNQIEVLPLSPNDDRLRIALYRAIYSGPLFRYSVGAQNPIHIIVRNGRVTLKGIVDSEGDKNIANVRARGVPGTFEVRNELVVAKRRG